MNSTEIFNKKATEFSPSAGSMTDKKQAFYMVGYSFLARSLPANFLDIPPLPADRFSKEGDFYELSDVHDIIGNYEVGKNYPVLTVYHVELNRELGKSRIKGSSCPLRFDLSARPKDKGSMDVILYAVVQKDKPNRIPLIQFEWGSSEARVLYPKANTRTLSEYIAELL